MAIAPKRTREMNGKQLRNSVLQLAISGKLVPQDPADEPASELLRRINPKAAPLPPDDAPFPIPDSWVWCKLGDIGKWQSGATPSRTRSDYYGGNIPWLKTGDLNDGLIENIPENITQKALEETSVKLNPAGSVLIAMYGATVGKIGILTFPATTNQACCACCEYKIDKMYLFYFLLSNRANFIAKGAGGAQPNISKEKIVATPIPLPPLEEQERIVRKLEELFACIERYDKAQTALDRLNASLKGKLRASILREAISGRLVPQDPNDEPAALLLRRINSKFIPQQTDQPLPQGWTAAPMSMLCSLTDGEKTQNKEMVNLDAKYLRGQSEGKTLSAGKYVLAGNLMILVDGENSGEVFRTPTEGYQGSTFKLLTIDKNMCEEFVLHVINSHRKKLRENKVGAAIPHLNKKLFREITVLIPPLAEQKRIVAKVEAAFAVLDGLR